MRQVISIFTEIPSKLILAHTFAYISLDAMIPQEADQTHIEYGFPVIQREFVVLKFACSLLARLIDFSCHIPLQSILTLYSTACELLLRHNPLRFVLNNHF